jgi:hypothetical protein
MDLVGSGRRLSSAELLTAANKFGVDVATLRAILQVETAGAGFDAKKRTRPVVSRGMIGMHRPHPREDRARLRPFATHWCSAITRQNAPASGVPTGFPS